MSDEDLQDLGEGASPIILAPPVKKKAKPEESTAAPSAAVAVVPVTELKTLAGVIIEMVRGAKAAPDGTDYELEVIERDHDRRIKRMRIYAVPPDTR